MTRYTNREIALSFHQLASIHRIHQPLVYFGFGRLIKYIREKKKKKKKTNIKWLFVVERYQNTNITGSGYSLMAPVLVGGGG